MNSIIKLIVFLISPLGENSNKLEWIRKIIMVKFNHHYFYLLKKVLEIVIVIWNDGKFEQFKSLVKVEVHN